MMNKIILLFILIFSSGLFGQKIIHNDKNFKIISFTENDCQFVIDSLLVTYKRMKNELNLTPKKKLVVKIFKNQKDFWRNAFPGRKNNQRTTGYFDFEKNIIFLTSPFDTSIKSFEKMCKVPVHELIHFIISHDFTDLREGIAVYFANQLKSFYLNEVPQKDSDLIFYSKNKAATVKAYNFSGWKIKFIYERLLERSSDKFKKFLKKVTTDDYYYLLGFKNEEKFYNEFIEYMKEQKDFIQR